MVTTEVRVTAEASVTSDDHITPPSTPTPSIAPVLPCKPATHHGHHPWASPSADQRTIDLDADDLDLGGRSPSRSLSNRTRKNAAATGSTAFAPYTTISTNYIPPGTGTTTRPRRARHHASSPRASWPSRLRSGARHFLVKLSNLDPVKLAYLRTSFVFAISILITWAPSSINRVYTLLYPARFNFGLNMASAVVLPLQGVWNAVIYCATSWCVLVEEAAAVRTRWTVPGAGFWGSGRGRGRGGFSASGGPGAVFDGGFEGMGRRGVRERGFELSPTPRVSTMRVVRDGSF